ncbi:hypothetical protein ACFYNW_24140 [Streptomyces virginiae]|uniref:hypothetical protein n=1 Tax=Streptomyces virginiae TaxID=1961 RepID=UPI0036F0C17F
MLAGALDSTDEGQGLFRVLLQPRPKVFLDCLSHAGPCFRRNHFIPVPEVDSLAVLNELVDQRDLHDGRRRICSRLWTIDEYFQVERPLLLPLLGSRARAARSRKLRAAFRAEAAAPFSCGKS